MAVTITVDGNDITDKVRLDGWRIEMAANQGKVGTGRLIIDDITGGSNLAPLATAWSITASGATPTTIGGGYIAERGIDKGPLTAGTQRQFGPVLEDWNTALTDRVFKGSAANRPEETDYQRVTWLLGQDALGHLDGAGQVPNTNTVTMDATNYRGKTPLDVLDDCAESAGKNFYVYYESGTGWVLYYDKTGSTEAAFTSSLQISDDLGDIDNSTVFGPSDVDYEEDPERIYSVLNVKWKDGWVYEKENATASSYRNLQRTVTKENIRKASRARAWAQRQLAKLNEPAKKLELTVSVPESVLGELRAGMRIQVKLRSRGITGFTYFRIAESVISPRQGRRGVSDAEFDVRLKMFDKLRPVNLDDDYGGGDSSGNDGTGAGTVGGGTRRELLGHDAQAYTLDDFDRDSDTLTVIGVGEGVSNSWSGGTHTFSITLPTGWGVNGYYVLALVHEASDTNLQTGMEAAGFTKGIATVGSDLYYRRIDGSEGADWNATYVDVDVTSGSTLEVAGHSIVLSGVYEELPDNAGLWYKANGSATADPDAVTSPSGDGWDGEPAIAITTCRTDGSAITGGPSGYTEIGTDDDTNIDYRADYKLLDAAAEDPGTYTASGVEQTYTYLIRGGAAVEWGSIPQGYGVDHEGPWEGGNAYVEEVNDGAGYFAVSGGVGTMNITDDASLLSAGLFSDDEDVTTDYGPWGPWTDGRGLFTVTFKAAALGDLADTDPNEVRLRIDGPGWTGSLIVLLGDNVSRSWASTNQRGIVVTQEQDTPSYSSAVTKSLSADTYYTIAFDTRTDTIRAKLWATASAEPQAWDIEVARVADAAVSGNSWAVYGYGNDGDVYSFSGTTAALGATPGTVVGRHTIGFGDGSTTTFDVGQAFVGGTLLVWVDNQPVVPSSYDADAGTFTLDAAPYGDPADDDGNAVVEASWEAA